MFSETSYSVYKNPISGISENSTLFLKRKAPVPEEF